MKQLCLIVAVLTLPTLAARGEPLAALTVTNELVRFNSASPGTVTTTAITGLAAGDLLVGIDSRPLNNVLYGVSVDSGAGGANAGVGKLYTINPTTGAATLAFTLSADTDDTTSPSPFTSVTGAFFAVDFNPVVDRLRVVSDTGQNLRIDVTNGLTQFDVAAAYNAGDLNFGAPPMVVAAAYTNSVAGATSTTLFALDAALSTLDTQNPANNGTLNTVDITTRSIFADAAFDISGATGVGYVVLDGITLATINLGTAEVTEVGFINTIGSVNGLAVLVPEPGAITLMLAAAVGVGGLRRRVKRTARP